MPPKSTVRPKENQSVVLPKGILKGNICNESKLISSPFGQFRSHKSAMKKPVIAVDFSRAKAPRVYNTFFSLQTCVIKEGYAAGETLTVQQFLIFFVHIFAVHLSIGFYAYPGRVPHSQLVVPHSEDHILPKVIGKKKKLQQLTTKAELCWYCNRCNVYPESSTWVNFWIDHT